MFKGFVLWSHFDPLVIEPWLHPSVAHALLFEGKASTGREALPFLTSAEPPPMQWLDAASRNSDHSQAYSDFEREWCFQ